MPVAPSPVVTTKNVSRLCQMLVCVCGGGVGGEGGFANSSMLRTISLQPLLVSWLWEKSFFKKKKEKGGFYHTLSNRKINIKMLRGFSRNHPLIGGNLTRVPFYKRDFLFLSKKIMFLGEPIRERYSESSINVVNRFCDLKWNNK